MSKPATDRKQGEILSMQKRSVPGDPVGPDAVKADDVSGGGGGGGGESQSASAQASDDGFSMFTISKDDKKAKSALEAPLTADEKKKEAAENGGGDTPMSPAGSSDSSSSAAPAAPVAEADDDAKAKTSKKPELRVPQAGKLVRAKSIAATKASDEDGDTEMGKTEEDKEKPKKAAKKRIREEDGDEVKEGASKPSASKQMKPPVLMSELADRHLADGLSDVFDSSIKEIKFEDNRIDLSQIDGEMFAEKSRLYMISGQPAIRLTSVLGPKANAFIRSDEQVFASLVMCLRYVRQTTATYTVSKLMSRIGDVGDGKDAEPYGANLFLPLSIVSARVSLCDGYHGYLFKNGTSECPFGKTFSDATGIRTSVKISRLRKFLGQILPLFLEKERLYAVKNRKNRLSDCTPAAVFATLCEEVCSRFDAIVNEKSVRGKKKGADDSDAADADAIEEDSEPAKKKPSGKAESKSASANGKVKGRPKQKATAAAAGDDDDEDKGRDNEKKQKKQPTKDKKQKKDEDADVDDPDSSSKAMAAKKKKRIAAAAADDDDEEDGDKGGDDEKKQKKHPTKNKKAIKKQNDEEDGDADADDSDSSSNAMAAKKKKKKITEAAAAAANDKDSDNDADDEEDGDGDAVMADASKKAKAGARSKPKTGSTPDFRAAAGAETVGGDDDDDEIFRQMKKMSADGENDKGIAASMTKAKSKLSKLDKD